MNTKIKSITVILAKYEKDAQGEITNHPDRTITYNGETKRWIAEDGLHPAEVDLVHRLDRVKGEWSQSKG